jgi:hypothetical protein
MRAVVGDIDVHPVPAIGSDPFDMELGVGGAACGDYFVDRPVASIGRGRAESPRPN